MTSTILRVAFLCVFVLLSWWTLIYLFQDKAIFPRHVVLVPRSWHSPHASTDMTFQVSGVGQVEARFLPPPDIDEEKTSPVVLFFHGNAELIDDQFNIISGYHDLGISVALLEYRGYGRSDGIPGKATIHADAVAFYDRITRHPQVDQNAIIFHGRSLGGAVAAELTTDRQPAVLILESTFTKLSWFSRRMLLPDLLISHPFDTEQILAGFTRPSLIFHGELDTTIPVSHGRQLAATNTVSTYVEYKCDHNDFPGIANQIDYWHRIKHFLTQNLVLGNAASD